jgi:hypothetical protein
MHEPGKVRVNQQRSDPVKSLRIGMQEKLVRESGPSKIKKALINVDS